MNYCLLPKGYWKQDKTLHANSPHCQSPSIHLAVTTCNLWLRKYQALFVILSKLPEGDSALAFLTVLPCLLRNPGVFPPSAEGHHWVCGAEDRCVPEPQRSGQCRSLLPPYWAGFGKAKPPAPTDRTWNYLLKSISESGFSSRRVWEMLLSCFLYAQGLYEAMLLGSVGGDVRWHLVIDIWDCWRRIWILEDLNLILGPKATP